MQSEEEIEESLRDPTTIKFSRIVNLDESRTQPAATFQPPPPPASAAVPGPAPALGAPPLTTEKPYFLAKGSRGDILLFQDRAIAARIRESQLNAATLTASKRLLKLIAGAFGYRDISSITATGSERDVDDLIGLLGVVHRMEEVVGAGGSGRRGAERGGEQRRRTRALMEEQLTGILQRINEAAEKFEHNTVHMVAFVEILKKVITTHYRTSVNVIELLAILQTYRDEVGRASMTIPQSEAYRVLLRALDEQIILLKKKTEDYARTELVVEEEEEESEAAAGGEQSATEAGDESQKLAVQLPIVDLLRRIASVEPIGAGQGAGATNSGVMGNANADAEQRSAGQQFHLVSAPFRNTIWELVKQLLNADTEMLMSAAFYDIQDKIKKAGGPMITEKDILRSDIRMTKFAQLVSKHRNLSISDAGSRYMDTKYKNDYLNLEIAQLLKWFASEFRLATIDNLPSHYLMRPYSFGRQLLEYGRPQ